MKKYNLFALSLATIPFISYANLSERAQNIDSVVQTYEEYLENTDSRVYLPSPQALLNFFETNEMNVYQYLARNDQGAKEYRTASSTYYFLLNNICEVRITNDNDPEYYIKSIAKLYPSQKQVVKNIIKTQNELILRLELNSENLKDLEFETCDGKLIEIKNK